MLGVYKVPCVIVAVQVEPTHKGLSNSVMVRQNQVCLGSDTLLSGLIKADEEAIRIAEEYRMERLWNPWQVTNSRELIGSELYTVKLVNNSVLIFLQGLQVRTWAPLSPLHAEKQYNENAGPQRSKIQGVHHEDAAYSL